MQVTATHSFELEIALTGTFSPGRSERGPSYASGGEPAEPDMMEDIDIVGMGIIFYSPKASIWSAASILKGVDTKSAVYCQIVANILELVGEDCGEVLLGSLPDE